MAGKVDSADKAGVDDIMSPGDMKPILAIARRGRPVSCVVALTADKDGVILLDRKVKPKRLAALLKRQCTEAGLEISMTSLRFGRAAVDRDENAGLVTITVHKEPPGGLRLCLLARLRKAGFREVELRVDAGLEGEEEDDPQDDEAAPGGSDGAGPDPATLAKLGAAFGGLRRQLQGDLDALVDRLGDTYRAFGIADELAAHFRSQIRFLDRLDGGLAARLRDAAAGKDQGRRAALVRECLAIVTKLQTSVANDPQIRQLDRNPLLPLRIEQTATHTLDVLHRSLSKMTATP